MASEDFTIKSDEDKIGKPLKYFFYVLHFFLGLDFGYFKHNKRTPKTKKWLKLFCFIHSICLLVNIVIYNLFDDNDAYVLVWMCSMYLQHTFDSVVLTVSDKSSFCYLQKSLKSLDSKLNLSKGINVDNLLILCCVISVAYKTTMTYFFCTHYKEECIQTVLGAAISFFQEVGNDIVLIISFFIFYTVHLRVQIFIQIVKNSDNRILDSLHIYKSIVDMVDTIKKTFDFLYIMALMINTPNLIMTAYLGLNRIKNQDDNFVDDYFIRTAYCVQDFALLFAPAISAGLLSSGVKELKITLYDRLLQERNEPHASTIEVFLAYLEARSLNLTVLTLVRLDWSLPVLVTNLCISYQIVVVQLTHLY